MSEPKDNTDSISSRIKQRTADKARSGRVGGTEHKKLVLRRKKEYEQKKKNAGKNIQC
jgi:hypothetical protein